jgi:hypothetical protein
VCCAQTWDDEELRSSQLLHPGQVSAEARRDSRWDTGTVVELHKGLRRLGLQKGGRARRAQAASTHWGRSLEASYHHRAHTVV